MGSKTFYGPRRVGLPHTGARPWGVCVCNVLVEENAQRWKERAGPALHLRLFHSATTPGHRVFELVSAHVWTLLYGRVKFE